MHNLCQSLLLINVDISVGGVRVGVTNILLYLGNLHSTLIQVCDLRMSEVMRSHIYLELLFEKLMHPLLHCILRLLIDEVLVCLVLFVLNFFEQVEGLFSNEAQPMNLMPLCLLRLPLYPRTTVGLYKRVVSQLKQVLTSSSKVVKKSTGKSLQRLVV